MQKKHPWTRRDFIAKPAALLAASQLMRPSSFLIAEAATPAPAAGKKIITRTLGKTGIEVPIVSMGEPENDSPGIVRRAYELGIRHFDTAAEYQEGKNEKLLGAAIKDLGVRKQVTIATKVLASSQRKALNSEQAGKKFTETFEASLRNLQTDYVDVLYFHQVDDVADLSMEGPLNAMLKAKKEGKARAIGVSMHNSEPILNEVARLGVHDVVLFPFNCTMATDQKLLSAIERVHKQGVGIVAMKTAVGGPQKAGEHAPATTGAARTALLKWVLHHPAVSTLISAFGSYDHIEQNVSVAYDLTLTEEEKKILADKKLIASLEFCHQCHQCTGTCPNGADIPTLMRTHMYALQYYPGTGHPHETLASISAGRGLEACAKCETCTASCAWTVNIPRKIKQLQAWQQIVQA
jgi:predicted aldo/keto reductase-like oxidoreductase